MDLNKTIELKHKFPYQMKWTHWLVLIVKIN